jgi:hypothetical protein
MPRVLRTAWTVKTWCALIGASDAPAQTRETVTIRGQAQTLHVYGSRGGIPVIQFDRCLLEAITWIAGQPAR